MIATHVARTDDELNDVYSVRRKVFIEEQGVPEALEIDDKEKESIHFILYEDTTPTGAGRIRIMQDIAKAERVCILKSGRGKGLGKVLMEQMEATAKERGASIVKLNAQTHAEAFYQTIGYQTVSETPFLDADIWHVTMEKKLQ
ncbi:GNAT family N-acetyltransferase [Paenalkalicoccus suaedae]|uniref:GNAT family N-acetyltransferase n=1 Tax=Paenalkalicoccus suaedae TaxID=2592382 RepID=A0A859FG39_9BACI|nr:GNAT family N-acetyltransferase [Paenalkalicoccus suaedae]QKS71594.1 GNAT family N-acetyltransferase [Paenalkalicoccus suaedae]